jgi:hypothetical protein
LKYSINKFQRPESVRAHDSVLLANGVGVTQSCPESDSRLGIASFQAPESSWKYCSAIAGTTLISLKLEFT